MVELESEEDSDSMNDVDDRLVMDSDDEAFSSLD